MLGAGGCSIATIPQPRLFSSPHGDEVFSVSSVDKSPHIFS